MSTMAARAPFAAKRLDSDFKDRAALVRRCRSFKSLDRSSRKKKESGYSKVSVELIGGGPTWSVWAVLTAWPSRDPILPSQPTFGRYPESWGGVRSGKVGAGIFFGGARDIPYRVVPPPAWERLELRP